MVTIYKPKFNPTGYDSSYKASSVTNPTNGQSSSSSTSYAQINLATGSNAETYIDYTFSVSNIPENAEILSVECTAKALISSTSSNYTSSRTLQLYSGATAKGSATTIVATSSNSTAQHTLTCGTWTRDELENCRLRIYAKRGSYSTTSQIYVRFYGATITVKYWIPTAIPVVGNTVVGGVNKTLSKAHVMVDGVNKTLVKSYANVNGIWVPTFKYETLTETTWKKYKAEQVITSSRYYAGDSGYGACNYWYDLSYYDEDDITLYDENYTAEQFESEYNGWRVYTDYTDISTSAGISITVFESDYVLTIGSGSFNELRDWLFDDNGLASKGGYLYMVPSGSAMNGLNELVNLDLRLYVWSSPMTGDYDYNSFYIDKRETELTVSHTYKWVCGDYIEDVTSYDSSEYPINGRSGDYWYIKQ
jgi:hypothetical protein